MVATAGCLRAAIRPPLSICLAPADHSATPLVSCACRRFRHLGKLDMWMPPASRDFICPCRSWNSTKSRCEPHPLDGPLSASTHQGRKATCKKCGESLLLPLTSPGPSKFSNFHARRSYDPGKSGVTGRLNFSSRPIRGAQGGESPSRVSETHHHQGVPCR